MEGVKELLQCFGKKGVGHRIHYLLTFKACCKVDQFAAAAVQAAMRQ